jgi:hypothetical protein
MGPWAGKAGGGHPIAGLSFRYDGYDGYDRYDRDQERT